MFGSVYSLNHTLTFRVAKVKELVLFFQKVTRVMARPDLPLPETGLVMGGRNGNGRMVVLDC